MLARGQGWVDMGLERLERYNVCLILCGLQLDCWSLAEAAWQLGKMMEHHYQS